MFAETYCADQFDIIMFVLSVFACLSASVFWEFDEKIFQSLVNNSFEKPIFMLCYATYCPHCRGLPELFRNFSEIYAPGDDLIVTTLNCEENKAVCRKLPMVGTPHITLVMGTDSEYWPVADERTMESWSPWIAKFVGNQFREVKTDEELEEAKVEPTGGGATFVLEVRSADDPVFDVLLPLTRVYRIYNDTFVYRVNPSASKPRFSVYQNKFCGIDFRGEFNEAELKEFLDVHRHGITHPYRPSEFSELMAKKTALIYVNNRGELSGSQLEGVLNMPNGLCSDVIFGWTHTEDQRGILELTGRPRMDLPFLYGFNAKTGCDWIYQGRLGDLHKSNFTEMVIEGKCVKELNVLVRKLLETIAYVIFLTVFGCLLFLSYCITDTAKKVD